MRDHPRSILRKLPICQALATFFMEHALKLLAEHDISDYTLHLVNRAKRVGICFKQGKIIEISIKMIKYKFDMAIDAFKHEMAHAIDIKRHGYSSHGERFAAICAEIGANPSRRISDEGYQRSAYKYSYTCPACGYTGYRNVKKTTSCGKCSKIFDERYIMIVKLNEDKIP